MSTSLQTQVTLIERLAARSTDSDWERFYRQYSAAILSFAQHQGLDHAAASDVLQETMILLMRKLPDFKYTPERGRFRNWLLTLVAGKVRDARKREWARRPASLLEFEGDGESPLERSLVAPDPDAAAALDGAWRQALAEAAMRRLDCQGQIKPETLAIFKAYAIEGMPAGEVAARFGVKENAVYQIRNRVIERLRQEVAAIESAGECWAEGR